MVALMALSNKFGPMLLTTGNKSEMSVGYATLYGDMSGGYNRAEGRLQDDGVRSVALAQPQQAGRRARSRRPGHAGERDQPSRRPPSSGPARRTRTACRPIPTLDRILEALIDKELSVREVAAATGEPDELVAKMEQLVLRAEYKRRQAPPGVKIGVRNFGRDRRYPISNFFHTGLAK